MKKNIKKNKSLKTAFIVFLSLTLVFGLSSVALANHYMNRISKVDDETIIDQDDYEREEEYNPEDAYDENGNSIFVWGEVDQIYSSNRINILLVGQDRRPGEGRTRSDAMILASVNPSTSEINLISIQRDAYVQLPWGYYPDKLNHTYAYGGYDMLSQTLSMNYGINCDGYVEVDFDGFQAIVNAVGGVYIYLSAAESSHLAGNGVLEDVGEGTYLLDGYQALEYARIRYIDNDFGRTSRQRNVITAVLNQVGGLGVSGLANLVDACLPYVSTNLSNAQIMSYISQCAGMLASGYNLSQCYVPEYGEYTEGYVGGMYVLFPDTTAINNRLKGIIGN